ncbi:hypothetical protein E2C01_064923 [Portunus trituberculatus]|uniref:Uncharacterized protein n=1 Tax=Portunus trituberculatus TaxID=210409 RepID=A0A5B7HLN3_PORTR|nr:hypothetical protein [Portunus trituberculatus]
MWAQRSSSVLCDLEERQQSGPAEARHWKHPGGRE